MDKKYYLALIEELTAEELADGIKKGIVTFDELRKTADFDVEKQKKVKAIMNEVNVKKNNYLASVKDLAAEQIAEGMFNGIVTLEELKFTGEFDFDKQKKVKSLLKKKEDELKRKDEEMYDAAHTKEDLSQYLLVYPNGIHKDEALEQLQKIQKREDDEERKREERARMIREIKADTNKYTPDEIQEKLSDEGLCLLCEDLGVDVQVVKGFVEPDLKFNLIPQNKSEIPVGYTDIFFWGIPSSGKTCALSAIFSTIKQDYSMEAPDCEKKFGATYRDTLTNIFRTSYGYLPGKTNADRTQYMPFILHRRSDTKRRKISFFELSGELFRYFYEKANNCRILDDSRKDVIDNTFQTIELLLQSDNRKIHFFFIDYNQETRHAVDNNGLTQGNYLEAAATYFRDAKVGGKPVNIFKKTTDAVYVVVTKSDEMPDSDKMEGAKSFLNEYFGAFMDVLQRQCKRNGIFFNIKHFSIGKVFFQKICKIDRKYAREIIEELFLKVEPESNKLRQILNN